jgi:hypothetical protein
MFPVDSMGPLLYDLVTDSEIAGPMTGVGQPLGSTALAAKGHVRLAGVVGSETGFGRPLV